MTSLEEHADELFDDEFLAEVERPKVEFYRMAESHPLLIEAIRPFAALAEEVDKLRHDDDSTCIWRLKAGDLRAARAALKAAEG